MDTFTILLALVLCVTLSRAYCPAESVFNQTTADGIQTFNLNTRALCESQETQTTEGVNICDIDDLNRYLTLAGYHIREAIDEFDNRVMMRRSLCAIHPMDMYIPSGHSVASTLRNGLSMISEITLNLTISKCHGRSRLEANLVQPMQAILCEMKRSCSDLVQSGIDIVRLDISSMDRTDFRYFTCKNLRRAHTLLHDFKHDLNSDINNVPTYSNGD
ncbi:uncharacterized protein LOC110459159 [Mizuhopecten yessoensis]|uniref:Uncharacterized protein n=1 Tax=Mizuhopecten yessoensis TaxID=6573 RepID=A0A210Q535_MIZYE|nr:uncharacterized protein LOC110459159 [Mizuhopecten yessoensis]OWF43853.1 hypothetical protein KP79_PYT17611 [Mizuhopecten yessoensis]